MAENILIYAENFRGSLDPSVAELYTAAKKITSSTGGKISAALISEENDELIKELRKIGFDDIYKVNIKENLFLCDDSMSEILSEILKRVSPSAVMVQASPEGRSIFSRVAMNLGCGLTADVTDVECEKDNNGRFFIKQNKPSFGENVFVTIVTKADNFPQIMTIRPGVFKPFEGESKETAVIDFSDLEYRNTRLRVIDEKPAKVNKDSIVSAETVVVTGRGALEEKNLDLCREFAEKIGAAIGCTRPMVDCELIPFDHQIGQTGVTIRPRICISFGVSGAIQHTEGIKDTKLYIAVNNDENAAVFNTSDYGAVADIKAVIEEYNKL